MQIDFISGGIHPHIAKWLLTWTIALLTIVLTGCHTPTPEEIKAQQQSINDFFDQLNGRVRILTVDMTVLNSGVSDIAFCSGSFYNKNGRWPTNYVELASFVKNSDGYLMMSDHKYIQLEPGPSNQLEIGYSPFGMTNSARLILRGPTAADTNNSQTGFSP